MTKTVLSIEGMACGMCEAHMNDAVRNALKVKSVTSSHTKKETVILSEEVPDEAKLREIVTAAGYTLTAIHSEPQEKTGHWPFRKK